MFGIRFFQRKQLSLQSLSRFKSPITAQRLLSLGYVSLVENGRALNGIENLVQRIQRIFIKYTTNEEVVIAILRLFSILSEQQFYQQEMVRHNVLNAVMSALAEFRFG